MGNVSSVALVVVTYNSAAVLPGFLAGLEAALPATRTWALVAVDNASADDSAQIVESGPLPATVLRRGRNEGYSAGINAGLRALPTPPDAYVVLNPDVRLQPGAIDRLLDELERDGVGIAVPRLTDADGGLAMSQRRFPTVARALGEAVLGGGRAGRWSLTGEMVTRPAAYERDRDLDWATGAVFAVSAVCHQAVGEWDESFFLYSEETDFALRARDAGFGVRFVAAAGATHLGGESNVDPRLWALLMANKVRLFRRRSSPLRGAAFTAALAVNELLRLQHPVHRAGLRALLTGGKEASLRPGRVEAADDADPPYICFASVDWWYHNRAHSDFQLMRRVAATRDVLLVNSIAMRMPLPGRSTMPLRRIVRKARSMARGTSAPLDDVPRFRVMTPLIIPIYGHEWGRRLNAWLVRVQVQRQARISGKRLPVVVVTVPTAEPVAAKMPRRRLVLNRSDKHSAFGEADQPYIEELETRLLARADLVVYASRKLMSDDAPLVGGTGFFLDHGVELDRFDPALLTGANPHEVAKPTIGFFGGFDDYIVDFDLIERLAKEFPDARLLLVGDATCPMDQLTVHRNVEWMGFQPYEQIPLLGSTFNVAIMPWLQNEWISYANPIKLKEYLALGLPVVSTYFPEVDDYRDVVRVARDADDFVELVRQTLADGGLGTPGSRRARVEDASWESKAATLVTLCEKDLH